MSKTIDTPMYYFSNTTAGQKPPYYKPLAYRMETWTATVGSNLTKNGPMELQGALGTAYPNSPAKVVTSNNFKLTNNKAISRLDGKKETTASFFEAWYERMEAVEMAQGAILGVADFINNWKKPRYWKKMRNPRNVPEAWLQYQFGIVPLLGTIDSVQSLLVKEFPIIPIKSGAREQWSYHHPAGKNKLGEAMFCRYNVTYTSVNGCVVRCKNPNTALLAATGLNKPFSSAWSVVPWGWAVDYFINVSQMLSRIEPNFPGLTFENEWTSSFWAYDYIRKDQALLQGPGGGYVATPYISSGYGAYKQRQTVNRSYEWAFDYPKLGTKSLANLLSAVALSMKEKSHAA